MTCTWHELGICGGHVQWASTCKKDQGDLIVSSGEQKRGQGVVELCSSIVF